MNRGASVTSVFEGAAAYSTSGSTRRRSQHSDDASSEVVADAMLSSTVSYRQPMNRIAIVGHPSSGYGDVLALLKRSGMTTARPSRRDSLLPQDINATLVSAHRAPPVESVLDEEAFAHIESDPVWQGMALDLMLGNLHEPLWGWADPQAVYTLNYWKELDPQLTFVLVYDEPHRVLMEAARTQAGPSSLQDVHRLLDNWTAYNGALLRFHLRNPACSVLVHAQQACIAAGTYLQQLQPFLDVPLSFPDDVVLDESSGALRLPAVFDQVVAAVGAEQQGVAAQLAGGAAERYLVEGVLASQRRALQLHAELQSAATLPLHRQTGAASSAAIAWESHISHRSFVTNLLAQIHAKYQGVSKELSDTRSRLDDASTALNRENERLSGQLRKLQKELDAEKAKVNAQRKEREKASVEHDKKIQESAAENDLLLTQLHQVQEELEQTCLRKQEFERRAAISATRSRAAAEHAEQRIRGLIARLKNAKRRLKSERAHEAELVRQQIAYRLGEVVVHHGRRPWSWLILPFALIRVAREHRKQQAGSG